MLLTSSGAEGFLQLIILLVIFVGVLAVTYYVTKWLAGYQKSQQNNKNLEIIETIKLTTNKYIQIVRAGEDKYFVIAIGKDEVSLLGTLTTEELKEMPLNIESEPSMVAPLDFKSILDKVTKNRTK